MLLFCFFYFAAADKGQVRILHLSGADPGFGNRVRQGLGTEVPQRSPGTAPIRGREGEAGDLLLIITFRVRQPRRNVYW